MGNNRDDKGKKSIAALSPEQFIIVEGAREHNLKNVDAAIPRYTFTVITGLSGSVAGV